MIKSSRIEEIVKKEFGDLVDYIRISNPPNFDALIVAVIKNIDGRKLVVSIIMSGLEQLETDPEALFRMRTKDAKNQMKRNIEDYQDNANLCNESWKTSSKERISGGGSASYN